MTRSETFTREEIERVERRQRAAVKLAEETGIPGLSAYIIASDIDSRSTADEMLRTKPFWIASAFVGSYARLAWVVDHLEAGDVPREEVLDRLPMMWRGSDPDDTDPRFLALWQAARSRAGGYLRDGKPIPRHAVLDVYRGQRARDPFGIAWSLDPKVAQRFQRTGGLRQNIPDGLLFKARARRADVLAYLTGRGESEVVIDPRLLMDRRIVP